MSKHTPGPWTVVSEGMASPKVVDANGLGICHTTYAPTGAEANACLIAAAPELLEALRMFVVWYGRRDKHDTLLPPKMQEAELAQAMRAIAKATGEPA